MTCFQVDQASRKRNHGKVVLEKLRKVKGTPAFIALLIKINGPDTVLVLFEIGGHLHDVIVGPHVAEQSDEATLVELDEFFGQSNLVEIFAFEKVIYEIVSRDPNDMLLDQGFAVNVEIDLSG